MPPLKNRRGRAGTGWGRAVAAAAILLAMVPAARLVAQEPGQKQEAASTIPAWFLEDIQFMTRGGGRWVAENRNPNEQYQQWGMEWTASPDGRSMTGRLFGFSNGAQSADFFQFRQFWHPGERKAMVMQWGGDGWFGVGEITRMGDDWGLLDQTFWVADGRLFRTGHVYRNRGDERVTEQYDVPAGQGTWRLNHALTWRRAPAAR